MMIIQYMVIIIMIMIMIMLPGHYTDSGGLYDDEQQGSIFEMARLNIWCSSMFAGKEEGDYFERPADKMAKRRIERYKETKIHSDKQLP